MFFVQYKQIVLGLTAVMVGMVSVSAMADDTDLAIRAQNPIATLVSLPLQLNYDKYIAPS